MILWIGFSSPFLDRLFIRHDWTGAQSATITARLRHMLGSFVHDLESWPICLRFAKSASRGGPAPRRPDAVQRNPGYGSR
jgi:hypothetical protein